MKKHETLLVSTILNGTYRGRRFLQMVGMVGLFSFGSVQGLHAEAVNPPAMGHRTKRILRVGRKRYKTY